MLTGSLIIGIIVKVVDKRRGHAPLAQLVEHLTAVFIF